MIAMKHEPQQPIRPRQRETPGSLASTSIGRQPKRVVIRVPFVEAGMNPASTRDTTPEHSAGSAITSHDVANVASPVFVKSTAPPHATPIERTIRIDAAHEAVPAPHAPTLAAKQSTGWLASMLQKRTLIAIGLVISILILAVVIHQRSGHDSAADSASPHPRYAKSERHASVTRKSQTDNVAANTTQLTTPPRRSQSSTATPPILRQSLANDFNGGPMLMKNDAGPTNATATATNAAANAPATLGGTDSNAASNELLAPKMPDLIPPQEALAPRVNSGVPESQYFGFAPGEGTSAITVATRAGASFEGPISNSPISAPVLKK
jgi:hypothetical protein